MRIVYVCYVAAFSVDGVNEKIATQVAWWKRAGHDVTLLCLSRAADAPDAAPALPGRVFTFKRIADRIRATLALTRTVRRLAPDVVYVRYGVFLPPLPSPFGTRLSPLNQHGRPQRVSRVRPAILDLQRA